MRFSQLLLAGAVTAALAVSQAQAAVYAENFDTLPLKLDAAPAGWSVSTEGTVSLIGSSSNPASAPGLPNPLPGNGAYVDLIGTDGVPSILISPSFTLTAGVEYTAQFALAGNQAVGTESVQVSFGDVQQVYALASTDNFRTFTLNFTPTSTADYAITFQTVGYVVAPQIGGGAADRGALLDNLAITAVPEPASYALMLAGLIGLHVVARRRLRG